MKFIRHSGSTIQYNTIQLSLTLFNIVKVPCICAVELITDCQTIYYYEATGKVWQVTVLYSEQTDSCCLLICIGGGLVLNFYLFDQTPKIS